MRASRVGTAQIAGYVEKRQGEKAARRQSIGNWLCCAAPSHSAFDREPRKVSRVPKFHRFIVSEKGNERRGFIEEPQYRKLKEVATKLWPAELWLCGLLAWAYTYGFRKGELLGNRETEQPPMRCEQVGLLNNTVTLYSGENDEGHTVALTEECRALLAELRKGEQPKDYLFTWASGEPVRDFRGTWQTLCRQAGLGQMVWVCKECRQPVAETKCCSGRKRRKYAGLVFHDQRRSAVRNSVRRGVSERAAMKRSGPQDAQRSR